MVKLNRTNMNKRSGKESRKRILSAATKIFSKCGYKGASMRMIATASDISLGGLYLYFRNKDDLYSTLLQMRLDDLNAKTKEMLGRLDGPQEAIKSFVEMRLNYARRHRELILVQGREGFALGLHAKKKFFREQRKMVEEIIEKGIASGNFRKCDVKEVAKIIICTIRGFILSIIIEPEALFSPSECSGLILRGLHEESKPGLRDL